MSKVLRRVILFLMSTVLVLGMSISAFASDGSEVYDKDIPQVNYTDDVNGYDEYIFNSKTRTTDEPTTKWNWDKGAYSVGGSSNSGVTLYSNYYFKDVVGRSFNFTAGSSNAITVDLVHKGWFTQTVVSTWTIEAGKTKSVEIKESHLADKSITGNYYFRFNSNPLGNSFSVSGTFE